MKERLEFPESYRNICESITFSKSDWYKESPLEVEIENTDYYSGGINKYFLTAEQIRQLKEFLNNNF